MITGVNFTHIFDFSISEIRHMEEVIFMVKESDEGGYEASALGHAIFTEADSWDELKDNVKDAVVCHFDDQTGLIIRLHFVKDEVVYV
ncbi:MAG TPA: hypothetical protein VGK46_14415 [Saprospiraceae bacterium]|jgi:hypothetical protein